jgi:hypothetical protein
LLPVAIRGVLDRQHFAAYIAAYDDLVCSIETPPPPYCHGMGALSRVGVPVPPDFGRGTPSTSPLLAFVR